MIKLLIVFIIQIIITLLWIIFDTRLPAWDQAIHLHLSLDYLKILTTFPQNWFIKLLDISDFYPPLYHILIVPVHLIFGISPDNFIYINLIFMGITLFSIYKIGQLLYSESVGLVSAVLVSAYPFWIWMVYNCLIDMPLAAMVVLTFYLYLKSDNFKSTGYSIGLGLCAAAGLLLKWVYLFFVVIPFLYYFINTIITNEVYRKQRIWNVMLVLGITLIIVSPWYLRHFLLLIVKFGENTALATFVEKDPDIFSFASLIFYLKSNILQMSLLLFLLFLTGIVLLFYNWNKNNLHLLLWSSGILIITLVKNKDYRFSIPLLPIFALISVHWLVIKDNILNQERKRWFNNPGPDIIVIISSLIYLISVFIYPTVLHHKLAIMNNTPERVNWKAADCINKILETSNLEDKNLSIKLLTSNPDFHAGTFNFVVRQEKIKSPELFMDAFDANFTSLTDYIIFKTGYNGPSFVTDRFKSAIEDIENKSALFSMMYSSICTFGLPDGTFTTVFKLAPKEYGNIPVHQVIELIRLHLPDYGISGKSVSIALVPYSSQLSSKGHYKKIIIKSPELPVQGLKLKGFYLEMNDVILNLPALIENNKLIFVKFREVIPRFSISGNDVMELINNRQKDFIAKSVKFTDGQLVINGIVSNIPVEIIVNIKFDKSVHTITVSVDKLEILSFIRIPKYIHSAFTTRQFSLLPATGFPAATRINSCETDNGLFLVQ